MDAELSLRGSLQRPTHRSVQEKILLMLVSQTLLLQGQEKRLALQSAVMVGTIS